MNEIDQSEPLVGMILRIDTEKHNLSVYGQRINTSDQFLTIRRGGGWITLLKRKAVLAVEPVRNQRGVV